MKKRMKMRVMRMQSKILIGFFVFSLILSGCVSQQESTQTDSTPLDDSQGSDSTGVNASETQEEIDSIDSEISELDSMLENSNLTEDEFLEVDESTFR